MILLSLGPGSPPSGAVLGLSVFVRVRLAAAETNLGVSAASDTPQL